MVGQYLSTDPDFPVEGEINMPRLDDKRQMLVSGLDAIALNTGHIPPAGQRVMSNSLPVVIASDQTLIPVREQYAPVAEDNAAGRFLVEQRNSYTNITTATTTVVKSGAGFLHLIMVNSAAASATITLYDNTAASGTKIATITMPGVLLANQANFRYDVSFNTGLTIVTTGTEDISVSWR
jgi:hypothetical protein